MKTPWPHGPQHLLDGKGAYIVTAGTYRKEHHFPDGPKLEALHSGLLKYAAKYSWRLQAWAVFPNHYHFVALTPENENANSLTSFIADFHKQSASWLNQEDGKKGRKVWHNYWETHLTFEKSYYARLHYVHQNAVHHNLVAAPTDYPYCSASWFEKTAPSSFYKTVTNFKTDKVNVLDDF